MSMMSMTISSDRKCLCSAKDVKAMFREAVARIEATQPGSIVFGQSTRLSSCLRGVIMMSMMISSLNIIIGWICFIALHSFL